MYTSKFRRRLSYVLLPVMVIYTLMPNMAYGSTNSSNSPSAVKAVKGSASSTPDNSRRKAEEIAKVNEDNKKKVKAENAQEKPDSSDSMATNYTMGIDAQVNPQTGQLDFGYSIGRRDGISKDTGVDLKFSYTGGEEKLFHLPIPGWKFNLDYIDIEKDKLYLNNTQNYTIDPKFCSSEGYHSGLAGYTGKALQFIDEKANKTKDYGDGTKITYLYRLHTKANSNEYFDEKGKLVCVDDAFDNHVTYDYALIYPDLKPTPEATPENVKLTCVTDSLGKKIEFEYGKDCITAKMPDKRRSTISFPDNNHIDLTDVTGRKATIKLGENSRVDTIVYPTGASVRYIYENVIPYSVKQGNRLVDAPNKLPGIVEVIQHAGPKSPEIVTDYIYTSESERCFTGHGSYEFSSGKDALMQSGDNSYTYTTVITNYRSSDCGGNVVATQQYNFLHLLLNSTIKVNGKDVNETNIHYLGENSRGNFQKYDNLDSNYNLPKLTTSRYGTREDQVKTSYDDYGNKTLEVKYTSGKEASKEETEYFTKQPSIASKTTITDSNGGKSIVIENTLSSNGKYIASSTITYKGENSDAKTTTQNVNERGLVTDSNLIGRKESVSSKLSYALQGDIFKITKTTSPDSSTDYTESQEYDINSGFVVKETDARGNSVTYEHYNNGLTGIKHYPDGSWEKTDNSTINRTLISGSNNISKTIILDGFGHPTEESDSTGEKVTTIYNELGKPSKQTDAFGNWITYKYDYQGRGIYAQDNHQNTMSAVYDDVALTRTDYYNEVKGALSSLDDEGNVLSKTDYLSTATQTAEYNGKNQQISSALSIGSEKIASSESQYDVEGNLISSQVSIGATQGETNIELNLLGKVESKSTKFTSVSKGVEKGIGAITSENRVYDKLGRLTELIDQAGKTIYYKYDGNNNLVEMTDFAGKTFKYAYDNMNRMTLMKGPSFSQVTKYHDEENASQGQIASRTLKIGDINLDEITYEYDSHTGLLTKVCSDGKSMSVDYDDHKRVHSITDYANVVTTYDYDSSFQDNVVSIGNDFGSVSYSYYTKGDAPLFGDGKTVKQAVYSNKAAVNYKYYAPEGKMPKLADIETSSDEGRTLINGSYYIYDNLDRVSSITQKSNENSVNSNNKRCFEYNDMNQLIKESVYDLSDKLTRTTSFVYDIRGNILSRAITDSKGDTYENTYTYNKINELTDVEYKHDGKTTEKKSFCYDKNGNMTDIYSDPNHERVKHFIYNEQNQLVRCKDDTNKVQFFYSYNAESLRKFKSCENYIYAQDNIIPQALSKEKIYYYYTPNGDVINEKDEKGHMSSYLIAGERVFRVLINNKKVDWYIRNGKDIVATVDNDRKNTKTYNYTPYGEDLDLNKSGEQPHQAQEALSLETNPYKYSGYYFDVESGLYYCQARYYSPELMRFISRDTYDVSNRYAYCDGDPVSKTDPNGHMPAWVGWMLGGIGIIIGAITAVATAGGATAAVLSGIGIALSAGSYGTATAKEIMEETGGDKGTAEALGWASLGLGILGLAVDAGTNVAAGVNYAKMSKLARSPENQHRLLDSLERDADEIFIKKTNEIYESPNSTLRDSQLAAAGAERAGTVGLRGEVRSGKRLTQVPSEKLGLDTRPVDIQSLGLGEESLSYIMKYGNPAQKTAYRFLSPEFIWTHREIPYFRDDVFRSWEGEREYASFALKYTRAGVAHGVMQSTNMSQFVSRYMELIQPLLE